MHGMALNAVVVMIIAVVSLALLLTFFTGPFTQMLTDTFCFFNNNVFRIMGVDVGKDVCTEDPGCKGERVVIESDSKQYVKSQFAAHTLLCWRQKQPSCGDVSICYEIILKKPLTEALTEEEITQYLANEGACGVIENSQVYGTTPTAKPFDCGDEDLIAWRVSGVTIKDQPIVLITYDIANNRIVVR
jgi:hypothetical protein